MPNKNKLSTAYIVGVALGDGNLSNPNGRALRLRITCDTKYPNLIEKIISNIHSVLPNNKTSIVPRKNCVDISTYSNSWGNILGWGAGSKYYQNVSIPQWILAHREYSISCLRGLIETDGSIYNDRGYKMVIYAGIVEKLALNVQDIMCALGFSPHFYVIDAARNRSVLGLGPKIIYHVRLSKNVENFLNIVRPQKY